MSTKVKDGTSTGARAAPPKPPRAGKSWSPARNLTMNLPHQRPAPQREKAPRPDDAGRLPLPCQMIAEASRHVVGQTRAIRAAVAAALYRHFLLRASIWLFHRACEELETKDINEVLSYLEKMLLKKRRQAKG